MPNYDVRYRYTDQTGAVYAAKTVVDATDGDNAVSLARTNIAQRLPLNVVEIIGVAPSVAFGDTQDDIGLVQATSTAALSLGGADVIRGVGVASPVNFIEAAQGATGTPGRVQLRAAGTDANVSMVLTPKGTGALIAQVPNSMASGGNARGGNAVDWQTARASANQVAAGANATIGGGQNNLANAAHSTVAGGRGANATGTFSTVSGGQENRASGDTSWVPGGSNGNTRGNIGAGAWSSGAFATQGDAQTEEHVLRRQTTDATGTRLTSNASAAGAANTVNLSDNSVMVCRVMIVARQTGGSSGSVNDSVGWFADVAIKRGSGAATTALLGAASITRIAFDAAASAWTVAITADTTNGGLAITVTGEANKNINWVARVMAVQVG